MQFKERKVNIYSRPRIWIPDFEKTPKYSNAKGKPRKERKKIGLLYKLIVIYIIATTAVIFIVNSMNSVIDKITINEVQNRVTRITNSEAQKIMKDYSYADLVNVVTDSNQNISMIQANTNSINNIASTISIHMVDTLRENNNSNIRIYMGTLTGITMLSGSGPRITVKITNTGNVNTSLKSELSSAGINQTLHRIYLDMNINVSILTPYHAINTTAKSQVLLAESIIVGNVPESYYYLNSSETIEPSDVIE